MTEGGEVGRHRNGGIVIDHATGFFESKKKSGRGRGSQQKVLPFRIPSSRLVDCIHRILILVLTSLHPRELGFLSLVAAFWLPVNLFTRLSVLISATYFPLVAVCVSCWIMAKELLPEPTFTTHLAFVLCCELVRENLLTKQERTTEEMTKKKRFKKGKTENGTKSLRVSSRY